MYSGRDGKPTVVLCRENMLAAERVSFNREIAALQAKCAEAEAKVSEARNNSDRLQNAADAADQKASKLGKELKAQVCIEFSSSLPCVLCSGF